MKHMYYQFFKKIYCSFSGLVGYFVNKHIMFINAIRKFIRHILNSITLAKLLSAVLTFLFLALCKYLYSGGFHIEWSDFYGNFCFGLVGWFNNTCLRDFLSNYLDTKNINLNLHEILFGLNKHKMGGDDITSLSEFKPKLYHGMDLDDDSSSKPLDKGKGINYGDQNMEESGGSDNESRYLDKGKGIDYGDQNMEENEGLANESKPLDKGKGIDRNVHPFYEGFKAKAIPATPVMPQSSEPSFSIWRQVNPGKDPNSVFFPKRVNPGPGFNVPGGVVPIRDDICQHIDYNSHILNQFRKMDLETAIEQRDNYLKYVQTLNHKMGFAQNALSKIPETPSTEYEFRLKAKIISDLESLNKSIIRSEARATLLLSRIEFIHIEVGKRNV